MRENLKVLSRNLSLLRISIIRLIKAFIQWTSKRTEETKPISKETRKEEINYKVTRMEPNQSPVK
jgi:uncharacterized Tic20 family protein